MSNKESIKLFENRKVRSVWDAELIIIIPAFAAGTWQLKVSTQYGTGKQLKEARTATFDRTLTVL